jgi:hypothetical protein
MGKYLSLLADVCEISEQSEKRDHSQVEKPFSADHQMLALTQTDVNSHNSQFSHPEADKAVIPRLPWQLERLVSAAASNLLSDVPIRGVVNTNHYVMAWGCAYLAGAHKQALERLWHVHNVWNAL